MSEKFTSLLAACAATFVVFVATTPASAKQRPITVTAPAQDIPVRFVSYRDLNLVEAKDEEILVSRVRVAAKDVCVESIPSGAQFRFNNATCRTSAWNGARPQIDRAVTRAREIATNGWSAIAPVAISISAQ